MIDQKTIDDLTSDYIIEGNFLHAGDVMTSFGRLDKIIEAAFAAGVTSGIVVALKSIEEKLEKE